MKRRIISRHKQKYVQQKKDVESMHFNLGYVAIEGVAGKI